MTVHCQALLHDVLLGTRHWSDLVEAGFDIRGTRDGWIFGPSTKTPIMVAFADLARGMAEQVKSADEGREWARFILAATDLFDLEAVSESSEEGLEALWDLSGGDSGAARTIAQRLERGA